MTVPTLPSTPAGQACPPMNRGVTKTSLSIQHSEAGPLNGRFRPWAWTTWTQPSPGQTQLWSGRPWDSGAEPWKAEPCGKVLR